MYKALLRERGRQLLGVALIIAAAAVLLAGYVNVKDEIDVPIQLPYILTGGVGSLMLTGLAMVAFRSQDDKGIRDRLAAVETAQAELGDSVTYLTQLLEAALIEEDQPSRSGGSRSIEAAVASN